MPYLAQNATPCLKHRWINSFRKMITGSVCVVPVARQVLPSGSNLSKKASQHPLHRMRLAGLANSLCRNIGIIALVIWSARSGAPVSYSVGRLTAQKGNFMKYYDCLMCGLPCIALPSDGKLYVYEVCSHKCLARLQAVQQPVAADAAIRRCSECRAMLEEKSVYCDNCGTDTPRR